MAISFFWMLNMIRAITFDEILPIWKYQLWPNRQSKIETHSVMTWPLTKTQQYDMNIFRYPAYFFGMFENNTLVGVNSGHKTSDNEFRSRGLWVDPVFRNQGIASKLLRHTIDIAKITGATMIWSMPRLSALSVYERCGFVVYGEEVHDGVEFGPNIYCMYRF